MGYQGDDLPTPETIKQAGRPFVPSDAQRVMVRRMSGHGTPHKDICALICNLETGRGIDQKTLVKHFAKELQEGRAEANDEIAKCLHEIARDPDDPKRVTAAIFLSKVHLRWRENDEVKETKGPDRPAVVFNFASEAAALEARAKMGLDDAPVEEA